MYPRKRSERKGNSLSGRLATAPSALHSEHASFRTAQPHNDPRLCTVVHSEDVALGTRNCSVVSTEAHGRGGNPGRARMLSGSETASPSLQIVHGLDAAVPFASTNGRASIDERGRFLLLLFEFIVPVDRVVVLPAGLVLLMSKRTVA